MNARDLRCCFFTVALGLGLSAIGCAPARMALEPNPVFVAANDHEAVWERTVDVLHAYQFPIARENKPDGIIETDYKVGAGLLEPWHQDSLGGDERLESSLQSIRRRVYVTLNPSVRGYLISVEVFKELEDLNGPASNSAGAATFQESTPLQRDLNRVVGQAAPSGWIPIGRDARLEQAILQNLQAAFGQTPGNFNSRS